MQPRIETLPAKNLVGTCTKMSLMINKTGELWKNFMPRRKEIPNPVSDDLFSLQVYPADYFQKFNPGNEFVKWALIEVSDFETIPEGMQAFNLPGGLYAVFTHKGAHDDSRIFQYIFENWFPVSKYLIDERPHFEVLGDKYNNADASSEEEIWIPVKLK